MVTPPPEPRVRPERRVPPLAHFVYGLRDQVEPFHLVHYLAVESCRRVLAPETIYFHHRQLPYGLWWDRIRPHLTLVEVDEAPEVLATAYDEREVPARYRYAHHADVIRLDALATHGGVYADIDTLFFSALPDELLAAPFTIGDEGPQRDERTGLHRRSLCNALMLAEPGSTFVEVWRERLAGALNGTWSNHSGFLAQELSEALPDEVRVEPPMTFLPAPCSPLGLHQLLETDGIDTSRSVSVHLWAHLWWEADRLDFSVVHAGTVTPEWIRQADTAYARLARPFLPEDLDLW